MNVDTNKCNGNCFCNCDKERRDAIKSAAGKYKVSESALVEGPWRTLTTEEIMADVREFAKDVFK